MVYSLINESTVDGKRTIGIELLKGDDEQRIEVEDATPDGGLYFGHGRAMESGRWVKPEYVPKAMKAWTKGVIADYGQSYGLKHVSDRFRDIVETFEPGVHQFLPFQILGSKKVVLADRWLMIVSNRLDSVDREKTTLILWKGAIWSPAQDFPSSEWPIEYDPSKPNKIVFNNEAIGAHHLWYDRHLSYGPYISDTLAEAFTAAAITGIRLAKKETI